MSTNLILDRASKNLQAMVAAATKASADLGTLTTESISVAERIEDLNAQAAELTAQNEHARRSAAAELSLRVKEDRDGTLQELLKEQGLANITLTEVDGIRKDLEARLAKDDADLKAAVAVAVANVTRDFKAEAAQAEANNKVATAEKDATIQQQKQQLEFMALQVTDLRQQITDERTTRLQIAQADAGKQGVIVNAGK